MQKGVTVQKQKHNKVWGKLAEVMKSNYYYLYENRSSINK